jgi:tetratricopeptide (TPR) repeat protein
MVTLTYMMDGALWGGGPFGFHLTNLLLHVLNVLLLLEIARRLGMACRGAVFGAALFAVHPVFTEIVAFPNYREDLLVLLFSLASLWCLTSGNTWPEGQNPENEEIASALGGRTESKEQGKRCPLLYCFLSALLYFFALLSKENGLGFLLFLFLSARFLRPGHAPRILCPGQTSRFTFYALRITHYPSGAGALRLSPHLLLTLLYIILRFIIYGTSSEVKTPFVGDSFLMNALTMGGVTLSYLPLILFPIHLRAEYLVSPVSSVTDALLAILGMAMLLAVAGWAVFGRQRWAALGLGWWLAFLLPVMNLYPIAHPKAERYLYLPCAGLFLMMGLGMEHIVSRVSSKWAGRGLLAAAVLAIFCFIALAQARVTECRTDFRLWKAAVRCEPDAADAHNNLGIEYLDRDQPEKSLQEFRRAWELQPSLRVELNLARAKLQQAVRSGKADAETFEATIQTYRKAITAIPESASERASLHHGLAIVLRKAGRLAEALSEHQQAEALSPYSDETYLHYGITLQLAMDREAAIQRYRQAIALFPDRAQTHYNLGTALEEQNRPEDAFGAYAEALRLDPRYASAHAGMATTLLRMKKPQEALKHFEAALASHPGRADWRFNYLQALLQAGHAEKAREQLKAIPPDNLPPAQRQALERLRQQFLTSDMP